MNCSCRCIDSDFRLRFRMLVDVEIVRVNRLPLLNCCMSWNCIKRFNRGPVETARMKKEIVGNSQILSFFFMS